MRKTLIVFGAVLLIVLARMCFFTVDRTEFVYLTQFGSHVATYDGADPQQAGLHPRWPWPVQSVTRLDRRLQHLDLPAAELVTADPREEGTIDRTLAIDAYVVWRIPDAAAVDRFIRTVGTVERARDILRDRVRGQLGAAIARMRHEDLISDEENRVDQQRRELRAELLSPYGDSAGDNGIEIIDIRLRRLNYPAQVRQAIFDRIISERNRKVAFYQSKGRTEADNIRSATEAKVAIRLAEVRAKNEEERGKADAMADRILNAAISRDPEYYAELQRREIGDLAMDGKKKVWSTRLFDLFFPDMDQKKPPTRAVAEPPKPAGTTARDGDQ